MEVRMKGKEEVINKLDPLLTHREVAALLRCSERTLRRMRRAKRITGVQIGGGFGRWMFTQTEVRRVQNEKRVEED
jgi:excisionase family DNA binding protein